MFILIKEHIRTFLLYEFQKSIHASTTEKFIQTIHEDEKLNAGCGFPLLEVGFKSNK